MNPEELTDAQILHLIAWAMDRQRLKVTNELSAARKRIEELERQLYAVNTANQNRIVDANLAALSAEERAISTAPKSA